MNNNGFSYSFNRAVNQPDINSTVRNIFNRFQPMYQNIFQFVYRNAPRYDNQTKSSDSFN